MPGNSEPSQASPAGMRPSSVEPVPLSIVADFLGTAGTRAQLGAEAAEVAVTGLSSDSRQVLPGDLYVGLPGAQAHGAAFAANAVAAGAAAVLTDDDGAKLLGDCGVPVLIGTELRAVVGPLAALIYRSQPSDTGRPVLLGVTGTNGKTTTTYLINALLRALGKSTGLIGTIEILAGDEAIPSQLTTPESAQVHSLLALMRERGLDAAAMEVSSHALTYRRVDGVHFDVAGFTNLTQDHLDLHQSMDEYFRAKLALFTAERSEQAVVTVDDEWGVRLAQQATVPVTTLTLAGETDSAPTDSAPTDTAPTDSAPTDTAPQDEASWGSAGSFEADWTVGGIEPAGLGFGFELRHRSGATLRAATELPGRFNVANAALAILMVLESGVPQAQLQQALDTRPFIVQVPGRMELIGTAPTAIVDFAHNPDALQRALESVRPLDPQARLILVIGATGQRDVSKRPVMGAVAAELADVVVITDDDPHDEDPESIRAAVYDGAAAAGTAGNFSCELHNVAPRAAAIDFAVQLAGAGDTVLVAGRGHEVWQEVRGINLPLDDRVELRRSLEHHGFVPLAEEMAR